MQNYDFIEMDTKSLKDFISDNDESSYSIIDVRQPEEYKGGHIPGSKLIALPTLVSEMENLPESKNLIFVCHSGSRSRAAAVFASSAVKKGQQVFNVKGGVSDWFGKTVAGTPKVQLLNINEDFDEIILSAIDLEKGAWNFYKTILEKFSDRPYKNAIEYLSLAEADHAEALYRIMIKRHDPISGKQLPGFDDLFMGMKGDILEGGMLLDEAVKRLDSIENDVDTGILELALDIEFAAYDLYKNASQMVDDIEIKRILSGIANGEKNHMLKLAEAFSRIE